MNRNTNLIIALITAAVLLPLSAWASFEPGGNGRKPPEPPQEAIDACQGASAGATVEITTPRGDTIKAVCRQIGARLAAVPERGPKPPAAGDAPPAGDDGQ